MAHEQSLIKQPDIENCIFNVRGVQVMLDRDLAEMYGVESKRLNEQVKRNLLRFPDSFRFQLTEIEWQNLKSQIATSKVDENLRSQNATSSKNAKKIFTKLKPQVQSMVDVVIFLTLLPNKE